MKEKIFNKIKLLCLWLALGASTSFADSLTSNLNAITTKAPLGTAVEVLDLNSVNALYSRNGSRLMKPASVMKLLTSYSALKVLGADYRFRTSLRTSGRVGDKVDSLYVVSGGDPSFVTESMWMLARAVKLKGIRNINQLVIDTSWADETSTRQGSRAYETASAALPFNFDALTFEVCPGVVGGAASVKSDPWEFPVSFEGKVLTVSRNAKGIALDELNPASCSPQYKLSGSITANSSCQPVYRSIQCPERYFAEVFRGMLQSLGVTVRSGIKYAPLPAGTRTLYTHYSKPLSQIVEDMNMVSSNFIAEQLLLALDNGHRNHKRRQIGLERVSSFVESFGFKDFNLVDASGLSHDNRISAKILAKVLLEAKRDFTIGTEYEKSLPVGGISGTLRHRKRLAFPNAIVRAKTGTIDGVTALAGYLYKRNAAYVFVILQNSELSHNDKWRLEEGIVKVLVEGR